MKDKIVSEAIKPTAGFINALLAPKLEKLTSWAKEKDLEGQLEPENLSKVLEKYSHKLTLRVSEITSLTFPLMKLGIFEAYEPLVLEKIHCDNSNNDNEIVHTNLIDENIQSCIVIDHAGMGKTTFSKFIVASILSESKRIPLFFELRNIHKELSLAENLASELDFPGKTFNRPLFYKLLELGTFYVILDGFDEVPLDYQEKLSNEISNLSIKCNDNIIILTSRPQNALPKILKAETLKFKPFTKEQAISLLKRYDNISGLSVGKDLTAQIDKVPQKFIESPLLVSLLYKTFGVNKSIAEKTSTFYSEIYDALYKGHDLINKNGYGREKKSELDFEDFRKLVRTLCYYMMLNKKTSFENWSEATAYIEKSISISSIIPKSASNFLDDLLVAVPLMLKEGTEIKFFHKTLLEYFAAEYIVFDKSSSELLKKLFESKLAPSFEKTFEFLYELNSSLFDSVITYHFAKKAEEIDTEGELFEQMLKTLIFRRQCKIGLWQQSKYSHRIEENNELIFLEKPEKPLFDYTWTWWNEGILNEERYFIAITTKDLPSNFHKCSWNSISVRVNINDILKKEMPKNEMSVLHHILGTEKWNDLSFEIITKIKNTTSLSRTIADFLDTYDGYFRLLSKEKINTIIEKVRKEEEFTDEIGQFL